MIELRLWRSFVVLAEELSFRRAAERLSISQPALTKQIQELETRLNAPLFRREARGVEPTEATIACLDAVRALLDQAQSVESQFYVTQRSAESLIKVGLLEFFSRAYLPSVMQKVRAKFPEARLSIVEMNTHEAAAAVADGHVDLGIARAPVTEQNVIAKTFRRGEWILVMPESHRLAAKAKLSVQDLGDDPIIFFLRRLNPELFDEVVGTIERAGRRIEIAYQAQDPMIGVELAASGIGLCLAVSYAMRALPDGMTSRPITDIGLEPMLDLVWRRDRMTPVLRLLIDAFSEVEAD
ncbi:MAG: LysR family transcriptional regulator [Amphiplicatus sp.]